MLDFRHETFLTLCKIMNYTKTADILCITQPAVSQHIKFLEDFYGGKLFNYENKTLTLTERGKRLYNYTLTASTDSEQIRKLLRSENFKTKDLCFGATLSIGEFVMPKIMLKLLKTYPEMHVAMSVGNTSKLLKELCDGNISFALVEGFFDKFEYGHELFSKERFIGICAADFPLSNDSLKLEDIFNHRLILRERGSGTRDIFERLLYEQNMTLSSFKSVSEVGSLAVIKHLVKEGLGITFLYKTAVENELKDGTLKELNISDINAFREFSFVYLKNSQHEKTYLEWLQFFKSSVDMNNNIIKE